MSLRIQRRSNVSGVWLIVAMMAVGASARASDVIPIYDDCSNPQEIIATVSSTDHVRVRYALGGDAETCFAVAVTVNGKVVNGYVAGAVHPDVASFERELESRVPQVPVQPAAEPTPAPKQETKEQAPPPDIPRSFAGLAGTAPDGSRVSLNQSVARTMVVYFWSANDKRSIREAGGMDGINELYGHKGVALVGVVSGGSAAQARKVIGQAEVTWPQILDIGGALARRYGVDQQTRYFILDRARNVVAAVKSPDEVSRELNRLRKQGSGGSE